MESLIHSSKRIIMIQVGDKFKTYAVSHDHGFWTHFNILPEHASMWGCTPEDCRLVEIEVKEINVCMQDWYGTHKESDAVYFGFYDCENEEYRKALMWCGAACFNCCFPYGADAACWSLDQETQTYERTGSIFIFEVHEI